MTHLVLSHPVFYCLSGFPGNYVKKYCLVLSGDSGIRKKLVSKMRSLYYKLSMENKEEEKITLLKEERRRLGWNEMIKIWSI